MMCSVQDIRGITARYYKISLADIEGPSRVAPVARARQMAMFLARKHTEHGLKAIGRAFGRDHTTVLHAERVTQQRIDQNRDARWDSLMLSKQIQEQFFARDAEMLTLETREETT